MQNEFNQASKRLSERIACVEIEKAEKERKWLNETRIRIQNYIAHREVEAKLTTNNF